MGMRGFRLRSASFLRRSRTAQRGQYFAALEPETTGAPQITQRREARVSITS